MKTSYAWGVTAMATAMMLAGLACGNENDLADESEGEITDGLLGTIGPDGSYVSFCRATLMAPTVVLPTKPCATELDRVFPARERVHPLPLFFAIRPDSLAPAKILGNIAPDPSPIEFGLAPKPGTVDPSPIRPVLLMVTEGLAQVRNRSAGL